MHRSLFRLYGSAQEATPCPGRTRSGSGSRAAARSSPRSRPSASSASTPPSGRWCGRVEALLDRFLGEEAERSGGPFEPWLLEAGFGEEEERERPALEIDGWRLHGAIDRVDRAPDGRALVLDYKLSGSVTALASSSRRRRSCSSSST